MASIPLPALQVQAPQQQSPLDQYGRLMSLRSLLGSQQLQQQQLQGAQLENKQRQYELGATQAVNESLQNAVKVDPASGTPSFDTQAITQGLAAKGYGSKIPGIVKSLTDAQQATANLQKTKNELNTQEANYVGQLAYAAHQANDDPAVLSIGLQHAQQMGYQTAGQALQAVQADPSKAGPIIQHLMGNSPDVQKLLTEKTGAEARASSAKTAAERLAAELPGGPLSAGSQAQQRLNVESSPQALQLASRKASMEAQARQQAAQGDPAIAGQMLAKGDLTLADLKSRGTTPQFITQAVTAAQKIKPDYNPADEVIAESVSKSQGANQFFGSANSLISKGGTLDQLEKLGKQIPEHDWPVLNTVDDWQKLARGKGPLAGYAATALGVADDYSKVMGGGTGSDSSRDSALRLFAKASSPEQRAAAVQSTRDAVQSQRDSRIGNNQFLKRMYGAEVSGSGSSGPANGMVRFQDSQGGIHDIPAGNLLKAQQRDPGLKVISQ